MTLGTNDGDVLATNDGDVLATNEGSVDGKVVL